MKIESAKRRGFCPRVWTPMLSGDGSIVRVHPGLADIRADKLAALVRLAERHGNGQIDITRRANLQLRGIAESEIAPLQASLVASGWAAPNQAGERNFALLASPMLGLEPESAPLSRLAHALEGALLSEAAPAFLHPKLCLAVDGVQTLLGDAPYDLWLAADGEQPLRVRITVSDAERKPFVLGSCAADDALALVMNVVGLLSEQATRPLRMHEWAAAFGLETLRAALSPKLAPATAAQELPRGPATRVGHHASLARPWFGAFVPFGSGSAREWDVLCELALRFGSGTLRVTPAREILLLDVVEDAAPELARALDRAGFIRRADDPLLRVVACTGAPLCASAHGETRSLARTLAHAAQPLLLQAGARLHVSGCAKSCAFSGASALTFVHGPDGVHFVREGSVAAALETAALDLAQAKASLAALAHEYAISCGSHTGPRVLSARPEADEKPE
jgi:precorrin-3B synthase